MDSNFDNSAINPSFKATTTSTKNHKLTMQQILKIKVHYGDYLELVDKDKTWLSVPENLTIGEFKNACL